MNARVAPVLNHVVELRNAAPRWITLFAFILSLFPIPVGMAKPIDEAYPCMHSRCGCTSAEQCWRSCCCNTDEQKLAWAEKRGVKPPAWFLEKMKSRVSTPEKTCCSKTKAKTCCTENASKKAACCSRSSMPDKPSAKSMKSSTRWVVLDDAARCKGAWLTLDKGMSKQVPDDVPGPSFGPIRRLSLPSNRLCIIVGILPATPPPKA